MDLFKNYDEDCRDWGHGSFSAMALWSKESKYSTSSHVQFQLILLLAFVISLFALFCSRCSLDSLVLEKVQQTNSVL